MIGQTIAGSILWLNESSSSWSPTSTTSYFCGWYLIFIEHMKLGNDCSVMSFATHSWLARSPDFNPIEYLQDIFGCKGAMLVFTLFKYFLNLAQYYSGANKKKRHELFRKCHSCKWLLYQMFTFSSKIIPRRCKCFW